MEPFRLMLTGGHPNSLGRTLEVVDTVLETPEHMEDLYQCFFSDDDIVRLRAANGVRRVFKERPDWFTSYRDRLLVEVAQIDQPSTKWTLAQLFLEHQKSLTPDQKAKATEILIANLHSEDDWIAVNMTMKTLERWVKHDPAITPRIEVRARRLADDRRTSVANGARKLLKAMGVSPI